MSSIAEDVALCMISWKATKTLQATLETYIQSEVLELFSERLIFFNEVSDSDVGIVEPLAFQNFGSRENVGIFEGMKVLAESATRDFLVLLENDCPTIVKASEAEKVLVGVLDDMRKYDVPVFSLRSRREPGEKFDRRSKYEKFFRLEQPLSSVSRRRASCPLRKLFEDFRRPSLRGCAIYAEEAPDLRHPAAVQRTTHGNWLTTSRYLSWSNNSIIVRKDFYRDVLLKRVEHYPAPDSTLQDIETAVKYRGWWRKSSTGMGQAEPGLFTHLRLDR